MMMTTRTPGLLWAVALMAVSSWLAATTARADQNFEALSALFHEVFYTSAYEPRQCGRNIMGLVKLAHERGIDLSRAHIVEIENKGYSNFGMVKAFVARGHGRLMGDEERAAANLPTSIRHHPGDAHWYYHAVLDYDGYVFDFDFTNAPRVVSRAEHGTAMFLPAKGEPTERDLRDIAGYKTRLTPAMEYVAHLQGRPVNAAATVTEDYLAFSGIPGPSGPEPRPFFAAIKSFCVEALSDWRAGSLVERLSVASSPVSL